MDSFKFVIVGHVDHGKSTLIGRLLFDLNVLSKEKVEEIKTLCEQLEIRGMTERKEQWWHKRLLNSEFPLSVGGGIGQCRLCMYFLRKMHIGEVHAGIWPEDTVRRCTEAGIRLL